MTVGEALGRGRRLLSPISDEADLEAELLLAHALGSDRVHLYQRLGVGLSGQEEQGYGALLDRRLAHEPTAYILGRKEFYGLDLEVTPAAIIPRPETELLVETALAEARRLLQSRPAVAIVDVGVGCGAIACALAANLPQARILATDTSGQALALARGNAQRLGLAKRIRFLQGDLLEPLDAPVDIIVANLPYVRTADWERLPPEIRCSEPREGLDGGPNGLRVIERLLRQAPAYLRRGGALLAEIGDAQGEAASKLAREAFPRSQIAVGQDLLGLDRVLVVRDFVAP